MDVTDPVTDPLQAGQSVLGGRFRCERRIKAQHGVETWLATDLQADALEAAAGAAGAAGPARARSCSSGPPPPTWPTVSPPGWSTKRRCCTGWRRSCGRR